ncbi:hypothetical protein [Streptomyces sp. NPDC005408]|uniref:hypothetical protein n=1 Tax=Streptomyces sp. NPDC005408 TaxID=3155341 RepID=UPI0033A69DAB
MSISQLHDLTEEDHGAVSAASHVAEQLSVALAQFPCDVTHVIRGALAPQDTPRA